MSKIIRLPRARTDLAEIWRYVADESEDRADSLAENFKLKFRNLSNFPQMGRLRDELGEGLRSLPYERYIIFYRVKPHAIEIVRVLHSSRDLENVFHPDN